jgi:hypothetical protein
VVATEFTSDRAAEGVPNRPDVSQRKLANKEVDKVQTSKP